MAVFLGLMGQKQSGKDSFASRLVTEHGFARLAFADVLKEFAYRTNPLIGDGLRLAPYVDLIGWEAAKNNRHEVRLFLQEVGLAARETLTPDVWVRPVLTQAKHFLEEGVSVVVTDVRFPNEAALFRGDSLRPGARSRLARVDRPGQVDDDPHVSERGWRSIEPDYEIHNDGSLEALWDRADLLAENLAHL